MCNIFNEFQWCFDAANNMPATGHKKLLAVVLQEKRNWMTKCFDSGQKCCNTQNQM